jgi:predicted DNA-binding transcriptional regulator AlpA
VRPDNAHAFIRYLSHPVCRYLSFINTTEDDMTDTNTADRYLAPRTVLAEFDPPPSLRTLDRWLADPRIGFPRPVRIGTRRYFSEREIAEFKAKKARERITF